MCGFAGILRLGERPLPEPGILRRMLRAIAHRGPDGQGEFLSPDVQLGAVRLAIMDPAADDQPVRGCHPDRVCVFNGEIYNHDALREELRASGHEIGDRCDTSVLPHLHEEHGADLALHLRGMFAIALWDGAARELLLVRDRLGVKPLFWAKSPDGSFLVFASELKGIVASGLVPAEIDRDSLDDLFSLGYPCPPRTLLRGVFELRPAHVLNAHAGSETIKPPRRYWRAPFRPRGEHLRGRRGELVAAYREALTDAVQSHLRADVPQGIYLSGGLDSSAIAALAAAARPEPLKTFTIGFDDPRFDESAHAAEINTAIGAHGQRIVGDANPAATYPRAVWQLELPLVVPVAISGLELSAAARSAGVPVVLTGDGADEALGGYDCFRGAAMRRLLDRPLLRGLRPTLYGQLYDWFGLPEGALEFMLKTQARPAAEVAHAFSGVYPPWYEAWHALNVDRAELLAPDGRRVRPPGEAPEGFGALVPDNVAQLHPLDAGLALELESRLPSWILVISDRCAMANGVEARVPFLDHRLIELTCQLPPALKMRCFKEKAVLRAAMRGALPESIRRRRKRPFMTPIREWFFAPDAPDYVRALLEPRRLEEAGLFEPAVVQRLLSELASAPAGHFRTHQLEFVLMLVLGTQLFHELFVANFRVEGPGI